MRQQTPASQASFEKYGRKSRRELFLDEMERIVPWSELLALAEPFYARSRNGRRPVGLAIMLRTYFMQQWFNLSDPGVGVVCPEAGKRLPKARKSPPDRTFEPALELMAPIIAPSPQPHRQLTPCVELP